MSKVISLKLLVDKTVNKVLFAEAGKEAVDFLCSILTLPIGTVIRLLSERGMVGCLPNLYQSIESLNEDYIQPNQHKNTVLKPTAYNSTEARSLFLLTDHAPTTSEAKFYRCHNSNGTSGHDQVTDTYGTLCPRCKTNSMTTLVTFVEGVKPAFYSCKSQHDGSYCYDDDSHYYHAASDFFVTDTYGTLCPECKRSMNAVVPFVEGTTKVAPPVAGGRDGFVKGVVTYMIMDDLAVSPMSTITGISLLNMFNVKDVASLEEKVVHLDMDKGLKLMKASFQFKDVLTKVFLEER